MSTRDTQRSKVYAAESRAFGDPSEGLTVPELQAILDKWQASRVLARHYPRAASRVEVRDGRGRRRACYAATERPIVGGIMQHPRPAILMPKWSRSKWLLAHEFAHHLTHGEGAWHGHEFCRAYLYLVRVFIGPWAEEALMREFKAGKVRWRKPVKRTLTEAQREAARRRIVALNERRAVERSLAYLEGAADGAHRAAA